MCLQTAANCLTREYVLRVWLIIYYSSFHFVAWLTYDLESVVLIVLRPPRANFA